MKAGAISIFAVVAAIVTAPIITRGQYAYRTLDFPLPGPGGAFTGIDGSNIVGSFSDTANIQHGFFYNGTNYITLDDPLSGSFSETGNGTWATGISGTNIVGFYFNVSGSVHGFLYNGVGWITLDAPGAAVGQGNFPSTGTFPSGISGRNITGYFTATNGDHGFLYDGASWSTLDFPGAASTFGQGISGATITGYFTDTNSSAHGFVYSGGNWTQLDAPKSTSTRAEGISGSNIVGYYSDSAGLSHGFLYDGSNWTTLDDPQGSLGTYPQGISGSNIAGNFITNALSRDLGSIDVRHGFLYSGGRYQTMDAPLDSLPTSTVPAGIDGSNIVGCYIWAVYPDCSSCPAEPWQSFLYNSRTWTSFENSLANQGTFAHQVDNSLATPLGTVATGVSGNNIAGYYFDEHFTAHGFIYSNAMWIYIDDPMAVISTNDAAFGGTFPRGISGSKIVGYFMGTNASEHGFLYDGSGWTTLDYPSGQATRAFGVSSSNIVGYYVNSNITHGFVYDGVNYRTLDAPQASQTAFVFSGTYPAGISGSNIVGYYYDTSNVAHGFLYNGQTWTVLDAPGAAYAIGEGTFAQGISGRDIVGYFVNRRVGTDLVANGFLATPTPSISIASVSNTVTLSWPSDSLSTWVLQQNGNVSSPNWTPTPGVINSGTNGSVSVTPSGANQFFRLVLR
jgi:hypothetical protein